MTMTKKDLIKALFEFPDDTLIIVGNCYNDGFDSVSRVTPIIVRERESKSEYSGKYEEIISLKSGKTVCLID